MKGILSFIIVGLMLLGLVGCKSTKPINQVHTTIKDSTIINYKNIEVPVPGQKTDASVNIDSLMAMVRAGQKPNINQQVVSPDGKMNLKYWTDELGKLQIRCETQDYVLNVLAAEIERIRSENKTETVIHTEFKTPWYNWVIFILLLAALILSLFKR